MYLERQVCEPRHENIFCFSFEVLIKLNPIQANIKGRGSSIENNQGGGMKICTITSRFRKLQYGYEPRHEKTNIMHMRKQRRRSASR